MKNKFEIRGDMTAIFIKRKSGEILEAIIDTDNLPKAQAIKGTWLVDWNKGLQSFYIETNLSKMKTEKRKTIRIHRYLMDCPPNMTVDHINHDTLDNRRSNLRLATVMQNMQNRKGANKNNLSCGIRGVSWQKNMQKWEAYICPDGRKIKIGYFDDLLVATNEAIKARERLMPFA